MILELATLLIRRGKNEEFEAAFAKAQSIIASATGYCGHELRRSLETPNRYVLLLKWRRVEDHAEGFRKSASYEEWKRLLHHYYDPFPTVEYFEQVKPKSG
jgi:heme-degrading monooxygenase HmoA